MNTYRLCYFSATALELPSLSEAVRLYREHNGSLHIIARTQTQLFDAARQQAFVEKAIASDAVVINLHGGRASFPAFDAWVQALAARGPEGRRPYLHIHRHPGTAERLHQ
jgi:cobaltochelatase CobN